MLTRETARRALKRAESYGDTVRHYFGGPVDYQRHQFGEPEPEVQHESALKPPHDAAPIHGQRFVRVYDDAEGAYIYKLEK